MVTAELKLDEIFNPNIFAKHEVVNKTNQYDKYIPLISKTRLPTITKDKVCMAEIINITEILENR